MWVRIENRDGDGIDPGGPTERKLAERPVFGLGRVGDDQAGQHEEHHDRIAAEVQFPNYEGVALGEPRVGPVREQDDDRGEEADRIQVE